MHACVRACARTCVRAYKRAAAPRAYLLLPAQLCHLLLYREPLRRRVLVAPAADQGADELHDLLSGHLCESMRE